MIVIATNNGHLFLDKLLNNLSELDIKIPISIIDTGTNNTESLQFLSNLKNKLLFNNLDIELYETTYSGYDSGAYIYTMNNIYSEKYYFIQDSIIIKSINFFTEIDKLLKDGTVVCLTKFPSNYFGNMEQIKFCINNIGSFDYDYGIFGPIFSILRSDVDKILEDLNFYPTNKNEQMAMERGWSVLFKIKGINIESIEGWHDIDKIVNDKYKFFKKFLPFRI